jgi:1,4-alpha-glucan branching enzyme
MTQISLGEIDRIVGGQHHDPHSVLGAHPGPDGITVRTLRPLAATVAVVLPDGRRFPMHHVHQGVFETVLPSGDIPDYRIAVAYPGPAPEPPRGEQRTDARVNGPTKSGPPPPAPPPGPETITDDPYRHLPTLGEIDLHLIGEGRHEELWKVLGAHVKTFGSAHSSGAVPAQSAAPAVPVARGQSAAPTESDAGGGAGDTPRQPFRSDGRPPDGFGLVTGTSFAVWAPNARGVRVIGDFNHWDGRGHPMRSLGGSGVWEIFVPGADDGTRYKYQICGQDGGWRTKADPMAQSAERPPATASIVYSSTYTWGDAEWLAARARGGRHNEPMSVYELHLGSWRPGLSYRELAGKLTEYVTSMGFTHVEFLPVAEHPFGGSWGYQVSSYYAPTARFGTPDDFRYLVDQLHQAGIGVFVDWVPAHFPRDDWALARFDGTALYEHSDPHRGEHPDWGTLVFDYGRSEVRNFLVANALYWLEEFHIDGLRVDAVASMLYLDYSREKGEWTPNAYGGRENLDAISFLQEVNATCYKRSPGISTIAEESTAWPGVTRPVHLGGLGFGFKWNMGWMHDTLAYMSHDPVFRHYHHNELTFSLIYAFSENFVLPLSHDEVVHEKGSLLGKMPGDDWRRFANLRALFGYMWAHPGKKLLFMGSEFGQGAEWSEQRGLDWWVLDDDFHRGVQQLMRDLNKVYAETPALWKLDFTPDGFSWIDANDAGGNTLSFLRYAAPGDAAGGDAAGGDAAAEGGGNIIACIANFSAVPHSNYRIGLPFAGRWREVINTDAPVYGGSGVGNLGAVEAVPEPCHGRPASATLILPPLGVLWLAPDR